jgi:hypothetical protein
MIRMFVAGLGAVLLAGSVVLLIVAPQAWPGALELDIFGLLILGSLALERRYRGLRAASGGDWEKTGERFVDPTSGELTEVQYNAATGERAYVPAERS